ncbi:hypothetical protein [Streptomyces sp. NPDC004296]|uniref:hypothetical protein n=1 Tax=Streptomyces sp. NPDC004296 TaxID=3364697 RepID=UPI00369DB374
MRNNMQSTHTYMDILLSNGGVNEILDFGSGAHPFRSHRDETTGTQGQEDPGAPPSQ